MSEIELAGVLAREAELQGEIEAQQRDYYLLSSELIFHGNSVQHWHAKACAYGDAVGRMFMMLNDLDIPYKYRSVEPMLADLLIAYERATARIIELESALDTYEHAADFKSAEPGCS